MSPSRLLVGHPVVVRLPVQWGEMDAYGHVNNVAYFRYFESARVAYLERCGFVDSFESEGIGAILHSTECRFRIPLRYPDEVLVGARARGVGEDRFTMAYRLVSRQADAVAAEGTGIVVSYDYELMRRAPLPDSVRAGIAALEEGSGGEEGGEGIGGEEDGGEEGAARGGEEG